MASRFKYLFNKYPFVSNSVIYGALYVTAECSQQIVTKKILVSFNLHIHLVYCIFYLLDLLFISN